MTVPTALLTLRSFSLAHSLTHSPHSLGHIMARLSWTYLQLLAVGSICFMMGMLLSRSPHEVEVERPQLQLRDVSRPAPSHSPVVPIAKTPSHSHDGRLLPVRIAKDPWTASNFESFLMVVGMHRSLTSALVQALAETMNFRLGAEYSSNWELTEIQLINDLLLQFANSRWLDVTLPLDRAFSLPLASCVPLHARMLQYLNAGPALIAEPRTGPLVIKDPRFCLTLAYWSSCTPKPPHVVFVFRSPIEVARSLQRRNDLPLERGIELWFKYNTLGLLHIASHNHTIIEAQELLDRPFATLEFLYNVVVQHWGFPRVLPPLNGGPLAANHTTSRPPIDRNDLEQQIGGALDRSGAGSSSVTTAQVMQLYDELRRRRFSIHTVPRTT